MDSEDKELEPPFSQLSKGQYQHCTSLYAKCVNCSRAPQIFLGLNNQTPNGTLAQNIIF